MSIIKKFLRNFNTWIFLFIVFIFLIPKIREYDKVYIPISQSKFEDLLINNDLSRVTLFTNKNKVEAVSKYSEVKYDSKTGSPSKKLSVIYTFKVPSSAIFNANFRSIEDQKDRSERIGYVVSEKYDIFTIVDNWGSFVFMILLLWFFIRRIGGGKNSQIFSIGNSKATLFDSKNKVSVLFKDVAGLKEAKEEISEVVDFLKDKEKFISFGAKIPKGILLVGSPGTGKTLLAKAVAGEAGVPFFYLSGSDFVEMFVGIGASRVRDLFQKAKEKAPCIIFIDEIDAIGRARGRGSIHGGNDERENTLNSLLVEMDGFSTDSGVIILAATNRPDVLDQALLRPGRFDRQIAIDKPDVLDREEIFEVCIKNLKKISDKVDIKRLAEQTPGFSGADIANICNEAALITARHNSEKIEMKHFNDAIDRIIGGLEKKNKVISLKEKEIVAYHESGHAVSSWFLENSDPLVKVTIVPRGIAALGYAQYLPKEQFIYQEDQMLDKICVCLGGRASEQIIFGKISTGALSDLEEATRIAYNIVSTYGMNSEVGHVSFSRMEKEESFVKPFSEKTSYLIDQEVKKIIDKCYTKVLDLLKSKKKEIEKVAEELLKREVLNKIEFEEIIKSVNLPKEDLSDSNPEVNLE